MNQQGLGGMTEINRANNDVAEGSFGAPFTFASGGQVVDITQPASNLFVPGPVTNRDLVFTYLDPNTFASVVAPVVYQSVPEPAVMSILGLGGAMALLSGRRRRHV